MKLHWNPLLDTRIPNSNEGLLTATLCNAAPALCAARLPSCFVPALRTQ